MSPGVKYASSPAMICCQRKKMGAWSCFPARFRYCCCCCCGDVVGVVIVVVVVADGAVVNFVAFISPPTNTDYFGGVASHHALALGDGVSRQDRQDLGPGRAVGDTAGQDGEPKAQARGDGADAQAYSYDRLACSGEGPSVGVGVSLWLVLVCRYG